MKLYPQKQNLENISNLATWQSDNKNSNYQYFNLEANLFKLAELTMFWLLLEKLAVEKQRKLLNIFMKKDLPKRGKLAAHSLEELLQWV